MNIKRFWGILKKLSISDKISLIIISLANYLTKLISSETHRKISNYYFYYNNYYLPTTYSAPLKADIVPISFSESVNYCIVRHNTSDFSVFMQVIVNQEYKSAVEELKRFESLPRYIIDAGSNVGITSLYLGNLFSNVSIVMVEPYERNVNILHEIKKINSDLDLRVFAGALWGSDNCCLGLNNDFRDGKEWSCAVTDSKDISLDKIQSYSLKRLMEINKFPYLDFLKVDIEGSEFNVFSKNNDIIEILKLTKVIAIEVHEECGDKNQIIKILNDCEFEIKETSEFIVATNIKKLYGK